MTKEIFMELLTQELEKYFPSEEYELQGDVFLKNNDTKRYGIVIRRVTGSIAPTVYIDHFYKDYISKKNTVDEIAFQIYMALRGFDAQEGQYLSFSADFEDCKSKVIYRLVSQEKNESYLSGLPHLPFLNLAIVFLLVYHLSDEGLESICITNELQKKWNVSIKDLYLLATENTQRLFPPIVDTMAHTIESLFGEFAEDLLKTDEVSPHIYIVSNQYRINGASTLLYEGLIQKLADEMQSNLYILPSSIHEILLIPDKNGKSLDRLSRMVKEINDNHVRADEILSDRAFYYNRDEKRFLL